MATFIHPLQRHISDLKRRVFIIGATIMLGFVVSFSYSSMLDRLVQAAFCR